MTCTEKGKRREEEDREEGGNKFWRGGGRAWRSRQLGASRTDRRKHIERKIAKLEENSLEFRWKSATT